jgi:site-specific recombinase XerD
MDESYLAAEGERLSSAMIATNTWKSYADSFRRFERWCESMARNPLPASSETLALWATSMLTAGLKVSTVELRISGVLHRHREAGLRSPLTSEVRRILNGARRLRREVPNQKCALTVEQLWRISRLMDTGTARGLRDRAIVVLGFAGAFRRSELAGLDLADVAFVPKGLLVHLRFSKTDQMGRGRDVGIFRAERPDVCPVRCLQAWLEARGHQPGPLFVTIDPNGEITDRRLGHESVVSP